MSHLPISNETKQAQYVIGHSESRLRISSLCSERSRWPLWRHVTSDRQVFRCAMCCPVAQLGGGGNG